ncbi:MAG: PAS domain-containing protein, partial [Planctomycetota bacterium]
MNADELRIIDEMPFLFWIKDREGKYLWGNRAIRELADEGVVGKTDDELPWSADAESLRADDNRVFETGEPLYVHETID